jgi:hypothetical protein
MQSCATAIDARRGKARKRFFLKKEPKTFARAVAQSPASPWQDRKKLFGSFFSKKNHLRHRTNHDQRRPFSYA